MLQYKRNVGLQPSTPLNIDFDPKNIQFKQDTWDSCNFFILTKFFYY